MALSPHNMRKDKVVVGFYKLFINFATSLELF